MPKERRCKLWTAVWSFWPSLAHVHMYMLVLCVIKPRCAHSKQELIVVCCVCLSVCKSLLYLLYGWVLRATKGLYMNKTTFSWIAIYPKMLGSRVMAVFAHLKTFLSSPEERHQVGDTHNWKSSSFT